MPVVVLLIVLAVIAFLLYKSVQDARSPDSGLSASRPAAATPRPRAQRSRPRERSRPRRPKPKVDEEALAAHVLKLRQAVGSGLISMEEAIGSIVRQTDGALGEDAARKLLEQDDAA